MSYIVTGRLVTMCHAYPRPEALAEPVYTAEPPAVLTAGVIAESLASVAQVSEVSLFELGSWSMKRIPTSPGGTPVDGMELQPVVGTPAWGMSPIIVGS